MEPQKVFLVVSTWGEVDAWDDLVKGICLSSAGAEQFIQRLCEEDSREWQEKVDDDEQWDLHGNSENFRKYVEKHRVPKEPKEFRRNYKIEVMEVQP